MAIAVQSTERYVKPLEGAVIRRFTVGTGGVVAGEIVAQGTDGVVLCDGSASNAVPPLGVAIQTRDAAAQVDVVTHGAINCLTGAAEGSEVYPTDGTAGAPTHTKSTKKWSVGVAESATVVFVRPIYVA
jgi:hypothetical protein